MCSLISWWKSKKPEVLRGVWETPLSVGLSGEALAMQVVTSWQTAYAPEIHSNIIILCRFYSRQKTFRLRHLRLCLKTGSSLNQNKPAQKHKKMFSVCSRHYRTWKCIDLRQQKTQPFVSQIPLAKTSCFPKQPGTYFRQKGQALNGIQVSWAGFGFPQLTTCRYSSSW